MGEFKQLEKRMKRIPLRTRIFISLQMSDTDNWKNGSYNGDNKKLYKTTNDLIEIMEGFYNDGMPEGFTKVSPNDKYRPGTGLVSVS